MSGNLGAGWRDTCAMQDVIIRSVLAKFAGFGNRAAGLLHFNKFARECCVAIVIDVDDEKIDMMIVLELAL